jgi:DNA-binding LacI/PurR family transcriptional regulator
MSGCRKLFGKRIVPHHMLNYSQQVYDILVHEIEAGRWEVNDRLPGLMQLARELNFGTKTIQTAYDRLKEEGYVEAIDYRGTFVKSLHPQSREISGRIGLLVPKELEDDSLIRWYQHVITESLRKQHLVVDVQQMAVAMTQETMTSERLSALFPFPVQGIISLTPFRFEYGHIRRELPVPLVFLVPPYEPCVPKVAADVREAYFDLTSYAIRCGHRRISFSEDAIEPDCRQTTLHREGYLEAMNFHRLGINEEWIQASRKVRNDDESSLRSYWQQMLKGGVNKRPTVVIAGSLGRAAALVRHFPSQKLNIPQDVSIVTIGSAFIQSVTGPQLTGMLPDFEHMVERCMDILREQREKGHCEHTCVFVRMHFVPGNTFQSRNHLTPSAKHDVNQEASKNRFEKWSEPLHL